MSKVVGGVGPAVLDQRVVAEPLLFVSGGKADVRIEDSLGGGCLNALKAAAAQGAAVLPVLLVGRDPLRRLLEVLVRQQFPQSLLLSMLRETRRSVLCGDSTVTVRSDMVCQRLPESTQQRLRAADLVLMAPMTEVDTQFVASVLRLARQSVLLLSSRQLADSEASVSLSRLATWTIVNRRELAVWTGCESLEAGLLILRGLGVEQLLVTHSDGVVIEEQGRSRFQASVPVEQPVSTVGAGDVFAGTFAALVANDSTVDDAVRGAQIAAAVHLSLPAGNGQEDSGSRIAPALANARCTLSPLPFRRGSVHRGVRRLVPPLAATSLLLAVLAASFAG